MAGVGQIDTSSGGIGRDFGEIRFGFEPIGNLRHRC